MANTIKLGNGNWATKEGSLLAYNDENNNFKPLPFTTTRASSASVVNKQGLIETVGSGIPRIDFSDDANGALLLEPTATNLIVYSEDFSNVSWTKVGNTVVTLNNAISPDGTLNASTVTGLSGTGGNDLRFIKSGSTANNTYTYSVYLKGSGTLRIQLSNGVDQAFENNLTLTSNWKRYYLTSTFGATATSNLTANLDDLSATATTFEIWGAQLEENSYATSYIKNAGTALGVTRVADTATGSGNSTVINSSEGVLYAEISAFVDGGNFELISLSDGGSANRCSIFFNGGTLAVAYRVSDTNVFIRSEPANLLEFHKVAISYKQSEFKMFIDGVKVQEQLSGNVLSANTFDRLTFDRGDGGSIFKGKTKSLQVYTTALSDAELTTLTTI